MSKKVDERVVSMQFDNQNFERNVSTTMSTLDKLKQKLNLPGASKGFENINTAANKVNMSGLGGAVETVRAKFSALEVMGVTALANITNSAVNAGKRIVSALTIDPIKSGFQEYETQINAIQTILANTESKGSTLKDVNGALDELNAYADKTIYNFTEMTRNIGTFTAAGVDLDTSVSAIKGIANLAAVSGSNSQQASTAMYQLSQALSSGAVKLQDWNSVVNAGMGGQVFQDALKETARVHGVAIDQMITDEGSFRETLKEGWLTSDILTETLAKFTGDLNEDQLRTMGYSEEQIASIVKMGKTANDAATKVKTFSQLFDTLKEAAQSGWTQSWEIIVGDFEEAKTLLTDVSNTVGGIIGKSAEARNAVLQGWKDLGGRTALIDAFRNTFEGLGSIIKPIKEAFREIFPPITAKQLYNFTDGLRRLTEHLKISEKTANNLKRTFKGFFAVIDIFVEAIKAIGKGFVSLIKNFTGIESGILGATGSIGDFLSGLRDSIKNTDLFGRAVEKVTNFISKIIDKLKEFGRSIKESFKSDGLNSFVDYLKNIWNFIKSIGSAVSSALSSVTGGVANVFGKTDFLEVLNTGIFAAILLGVRKFVKSLSDTFDDVGGVLGNVKGILDDVRGCFQAYQEQLKAGTLLKIASAIAILTASIFVISTIDVDALEKALLAITVLFGELLGSLALFGKISGNMTGVFKSCSAMITMSVAILILASALKKISSIDSAGIVKGLVGIGILMAEISIFLRTAKLDGKLTGTAIGIVFLSSAMLILAKAVKDFGSMDWSSIGKGLAAIGGLLVEIAVFSKLTGNAKHVISTGASMVLLGASMKIFASAIKDFGSMNLPTIGKGLLAMAGALAEIVIAMKLMPKNTFSIGTGLVIVGASLKILASALSDFGEFSWSEIGKGLAAMGGALAELSIALNLMRGTLKGSAALLVAAGALAVITPVLKSLGKMSWEGIAKSLVVLAGAFAVIGIAGLLLRPLIPTLLGLAGAFALFGLAVVGIGAGIALIGVGLTALATGITALGGSLAVAATSIVAGLSVIILGIADLIPSIAKKLAEGIVEFAKVIGECAPQLADAILKLIAEVMKSLATYTPQIVESLMVLLIGVINGIADHLPELIVAAVNLIGALFQGIIEALNGLDAENLLKGIVAVGLLTALMYALSSVVGLIPSAMAGVIGVGIVVAELALVLAAIGGLAQIPGLKWLIEEGGNFLQAVGTAIGQFVGGIVGGFMGGISSSFPKIGSDLSAFMTNIQPFVNGAKKIDASMMDGVKSLAEVILMLTAADILNGITSWLTGGSSLTDFAEQLVPFGEGMKKYADSVSGINPETVTASATAAKSLAELANNLPNSGGVLGWFMGENDISTFGEQLVPFGKGMKSYSDSISGINPDTVTASATAAMSLAELANNLPNSGGVVGWFMGENDISTFGDQLVVFGKGMKSYSDSITGINPETITASATAAMSLSELANNLPDSGGLVSWFAGDNTLASFGEQLVPFGKGMKEYSDAISGLNPVAVMCSSMAAKSLSELANNLPDSGGLVSWFAGDNTLSSFGDQLVTFGKGMKAYSDEVNGINPAAVIASSTAAKSLSELANNLPDSGGLVSLFAGDNDLSSFGRQLVPFGRGMKAYSDEVNGINPVSVIASSIAAKSLTELANNLPKTGGLTSLFTGQSSLASLGMQLAPFGRAMKSYANEVSGINPDTMVASTTAAKSLAELAKNLPDSGGLVSFFAGDNTLSSFAYQLAPFGRAMKSYSDSIVGINSEAITASTTTAKSLSELANNLPDSGGLVSFFAGDNTLSSFAYQLAPFGRAMKSYSDSVVGINPEAITASTTAAKSLSELANNLPDSGGLVSFFAGDNTLSSFAYQLVPFGRAMKSYSDSVVGINPESITASTTAAKSLSELANNLPDSGGLVSFFVGSKDLSSLGMQLAPFGRAMKSYSDSVVGINPEAITASTTAAKSLSELSNNLPDSGGLVSFFAGDNTLSSFAYQLVPFGRAMKSYSDAVDGINPTAVTSSTTAAKSLSQLVNNLPDSGGVVSWFAGDNTLSSFANQLIPFGRAMKTYSDAVSGINSSAISSSASNARALVGVMNNMANVNTNGVSSFVKALNELGTTSLDKFIKAFTGSETKLKSAGTNSINAVIKGMQSKKSELIETGSKLIDGMTKSLRSKWDGLNDVGKFLVDGLLKVIKGRESEFKSAGEKIIARFIDGVSSQKSKMSNAMSSALKSAVSGARDQYDSFYNAGSYLVSGLANGISANSYKASAQASAMASAAARAARRALGINSPSRVFYEIGDYTGVGFVNALNDYSVKSYKAGSEMALSARSGLSKAIGKIKDLVDGDIDVQPTIRPVLDLSDVKSGAGTIGDLFNDRFSVGAFSNVSAISSMMNQNNQNGQFSEIVSAIGKLRKDLGNVGNTSYNINGITYDDGSNVSDAVKSLVRAAKVERRI